MPFVEVKKHYELCTEPIRLQQELPIELAYHEYVTLILSSPDDEDFLVSGTITQHKQSLLQYGFNALVVPYLTDIGIAMCKELHFAEKLYRKPAVYRACLGTPTNVTRDISKDGTVSPPIIIVDQDMIDKQFYTYGLDNMIPRYLELAAGFGYPITYIPDEYQPLLRYSLLLMGQASRRVGVIYDNVV